MGRDGTRRVQKQIKSLSPPPIPHITCNGPSPLININLLPTNPEPGSPSVGSVLWCQDESGFFLLAIRLNLGKMQNVKCEVPWYSLRILCLEVLSDYVSVEPVS